MARIVNSYPEDGYFAVFNQETGFQLRISDGSCNEPFWCSYGPELLDISITNYCDKGCGFCYRNSSTDGHILSVDNYRTIISQASHMGVLQVAFGGGNPNQHPDFCKIIEITRDNYNIVPSYTTNGRGLSEEVLAFTKSYCGAVAISVYDPIEDCLDAIKKLRHYKIKTNLHYLLTCETVDRAIQWLNNPPSFLMEINAIIFLNYKPVGRNASTELLANNNEQINEFFSAVNKKHQFKIGFDSCSISGVAQYSNSAPVYLDYCEAARFSMFISEEMKMYPCSFMVNQIDGIPITSSNLQDVWRSSGVFLDQRRKILHATCPNCATYDLCHGGCPVFPNINFCKA